MTYQDLIEHVAQHQMITKKSAKEIIDIIFGAIRESALQGKRVVIPQFGSFKRKRARSRGQIAGKSFEKPPSVRISYSPSIHAREVIS